MYALCECTLLWSIQLLPLLSLTLLHPIPTFQQLSIHTLISSAFTYYVMQYYWCYIILFSFPSFPEFHRVLPLLQACSTSEFVDDQACFVYIFVFGSIFHIWKKTCGFCVSDLGLLHLIWCLLFASIYLQTTCHYSLWLTNTPLCIYVTIS
jgi:hypothetical protein